MNKIESNIMNKAVGQYIDCLEVLNFNFEGGKYLKEELTSDLINAQIDYEIQQLLKNNPFLRGRIKLVCERCKQLGYLDIIKLFLISEEVYHFWNLNFRCLINYYIEKTSSLNSVDQFVGELKELFDTNLKEFERKEIEINKIALV